MAFALLRGMNAPYRNATELIAEEAEALRETRREEVRALPAALRQLYLRRQGRIAFGLTVSVGAVLMFASLLGCEGQTYMLISSWALGLAAAVIARAKARRTWGKALALPVATHEPHQGLAALQAFEPRARALALVQPLEHASTAWPLIAVSLLGPLTLHLFVFLLMSGGAIMTEAWTTLHSTLMDFDGWIVLSAILVGIAHLVFVWASWDFLKLRRPWRSLMWATLTSAVPGAIFFAIPVVLTLVTGAVLVGIVFLPLGDTLDKERLILETIADAPE